MSPTAPGRDARAAALTTYQIRQYQLARRADNITHTGHRAQARRDRLERAEPLTQLGIDPAKPFL